MDMTILLKNFADPTIIKTMASGDLLKGVTATVIMGMGITFAVLIILMFVIMVQQKLLAPRVAAPVKTVQAARVSDAPVSGSDNNELIAVITAAVAASIGTAAGNIVIKNVQRVRDNAPGWFKSGITEQMNNRF